MDSVGGVLERDAGNRVGQLLVAEPMGTWGALSRGESYSDIGLGEKGGVRDPEAELEVRKVQWSSRGPAVRM